MSELCCFPDEDILNSVHRYRPKFFRTSDGLPCHYDPYDFAHTCLLKSQPKGDSDALEVNDDLEPSHETEKCFAIRFVASNNCKKIDVAKKFAAIIKQVLLYLPLPSRLSSR